MSGSLRDEGDGRITLTAQVDDGEVFTATGPTSDLGALEQTIAEQVYGISDPNNLIVYLEMHGRKKDAFAGASRYAELAKTREDRANAIVMWGDPSEDPERQLASGRIALRLDPGLMAAQYNIANGALALDHPQEALFHARAMLTAPPADQPPQHRGPGATYLLDYAHVVISELTGDFQAAEAARMDLLHRASQRSEMLRRNAVDAAWLHDPAASSDMLAEAPIFGSDEDGLAPVARYWADVERGDWPKALTEAQALSDMDQKSLASSKDPDSAAGLKAKLERRDWPMLAVARARTRNPAGALSLIAATPVDCYACDGARGQIAAIAGSQVEAERWFAVAIGQNPAVPLAYVARGRTRLDRGDVAGATSDAETARRLGPHFADALKLSGDALARQGRWKEAIARYDAALGQAPAWTALKQARAAAVAHTV